MGSNSSKSKINNEKETYKDNIPNEYQQQTDKNHQNKMNQTHPRHNESIIARSKPFLELESDISKELS